MSSSPARAALELAVTCCCAELHVWFLYRGPTVWSAVNFAVLTVAIASSCWRRRGHLLAGQPGSATRAWGETLGLTVALGALVAGVSLACGLWADDLGRHYLDADVLVWSARKLLTVVAQQLLLLGLVYPLFLECFGRSPAATSGWRSPTNLALAASALAFGGLHLPNPLLTLLTLTSGAIWVALYRRHGRILPLIASHLLLAVLVRETCYDLVYHMRVGADVWPLLPSTVTTHDGPLQLRPLSVQGSLDSLRPSGEDMVCSGWAADVDGNRPANDILVVHQGATYRYPVQGRSRPDVAESFSAPGIRASGFELRLPRGWFSAGESPRFFAEIGPDGRAELAPPAASP